MPHRAGSSRLAVTSCRLRPRALRPRALRPRAAQAAGAQAAGGSGRGRSGRGRSGLVDEEAADVAAVEHVAVALVDVLEAVAGGDQLVELEPARPVQLEHPRYLVERVPAAEQRALDPLLHDGELEAGQLDGVLPRPGYPGDHHGAALADR